MLKRSAQCPLQLTALHASTTVPTQQTLRHRLEHLVALDECTQRTEPAFDTWAATRLDRWLVDWTLRTGRFDTANRIAKEKDIEALCDLDLFTDIRRVEEALERHSCTEALVWCTENKVALRKAKVCTRSV